MDIQELRREAQTMQPQLTADRRRLHRNPEAGAVLPETVAYVKERLTEMGYHPQDAASCCGRTWMPSGDRSSRACPYGRKTAVCTPAATICTLPCCWVRPGC